MEISKKLVQDVNHIVNESKHLNPNQAVSVGNREQAMMNKKIKKLAFELADKHTNVNQDKVEKILERMAAEGDDLDDLEALEGELEAMGTN